MKEQDDRQRQQNRRKVEKSTPLVDSRNEVKEILQFPYSMVGYVRTSFYRIKDQKKKIIGNNHGSGILIAPNAVLTCAHNISSPDKKIYAVSKITFFLAYNQHRGYQYQVLSCNVNQKDEKYNDFALLHLKNMEYPLKLKQINFIWEQIDFKKKFNILNKPNISTVGYPKDKNNQKLIKYHLKIDISNSNLIGYQFQSRGKLVSSDFHFLQYNMLASQGQSGSPIFVHDGQSIQLIGIHKGEKVKEQLSYGITLWSMKEKILEWLDKKKGEFKSQQEIKCAQ